MDEFTLASNNEFEEAPAPRKVSNVGTGGNSNGVNLVKKAMEEASKQQPAKKIITLERSGPSYPETSGVRDIESRLKKRSAEHDGKDLESIIR